MIPERIKELYDLDDPRNSDMREALDALIEERAMRKKAEWLIEHGEGRCACLPRSDMRHGWADCHWLIAERKEILG